MHTWIRVRLPDHCGYCRSSIAAGAIALALQHGARRSLRCVPCAERLLEAPAPAEVPDDALEPPAGVPNGVRHQPSLGLDAEVEAGGPMVSASELARRRLANHLRQRRRA